MFDEGFEVDTIIKNISLRDPSLRFIAHKTLIFFDELQDCVTCATSLKAFKLDGRFDVICSGSMMGINYSEIESNSVGYKQDYELQSMDFEEYLWAKGYQEDQIEDLCDHMVTVNPLSKIQQEVMFDNFREYVVLGGMPAVVKSFVTNKHYGGCSRYNDRFSVIMRKISQRMPEGLIQQRFSASTGGFQSFLAERTRNSRYRTLRGERAVVNMWAWSNGWTVRRL